MSDKINLDFNNWKVRLHRKNRGAMKLTFNLTKEEAEGFAGFEATVKPEGVSTEDFIRVIFLTGVEALNRQFAEVAQSYVEQHQDEFKEEGVDPEGLVVDYESLKNEDTDS